VTGETSILAEAERSARYGRTPILVLCSRNARPRKGLVRRPQYDQYGCPSFRSRASADLEGAFDIEPRSTVVVRLAEIFPSCRTTPVLEQYSPEWTGAIGKEIGLVRVR
jgi:hypothetical protein